MGAGIIPAAGCGAVLAPHKIKFLSSLYIQHRQQAQESFYLLKIRNVMYQISHEM